MKALLWLPLLACCAFADEAADRASIARLIASANELQQNTQIFTADADGRNVLGDLRRSRQEAPSVTISREPFGEATINIPAMVDAVQNSRVLSTNIRFIAPDVALAEGTFTYKTSDPTPLFFVLKRENGEWRIAALRVVTAR